MRFSILSGLTLLISCVMADTRNVTNNLGSTPPERHVINQDQAQKIINAAAAHVVQIK